MAAKKIMIDRSKIRLTTANKGGCWIVTDTNRSRRQTAEVLNRGQGNWNVRIDRAGKPWKYLANVRTETPEAAYEYTVEFGQLYPLPE